MHDLKGGCLRSEGGEVHPAFLVALVLVFGVVLWPSSTDSSDGGLVSVDTSVRESIYVAALALNAEYEATGAYPDGLESIGMDEEGLAYGQVAGGYILMSVEEGVRVEYRSDQDLTPFRAAFESLLPSVQDRE